MITLQYKMPYIELNFRLLQYNIWVFSYSTALVSIFSKTTEFRLMTLCFSALTRAKNENEKLENKSQINYMKNYEMT